jgi:hypothetical protein
LHIRVNDEQTFRALRLAIMLVAMPVGAYHRLRATTVALLTAGFARPWPRDDRRATS